MKDYKKINTKRSFTKPYELKAGQHRTQRSLDKHPYAAAIDITKQHLTNTSRGNRLEDLTPDEGKIATIAGPIAQAIQRTLRHARK